MVDYVGIDLIDTPNGAFCVAATGDAFIFGISCGEYQRGIHIGPFFIGWIGGGE